MYNSKENITAEELFGRVGEIIEAQATSPECVNRMMHEALVLTCREGLSDNRQAFGNLFAQVDFLCKRCRISSRDAMAIQKMRRCCCPKKWRMTVGRCAFSFRPCSKQIFPQRWWGGFRLWASCRPMSGTLIIGISAALCKL